MAMLVHGYSPKGGVGKSTTSVNLAGYYSVEKRLKVCVVDYDEQQTICDIYSDSLCGFDVRVNAPSESEGFDVVIFDHHPTHGIVEFSGIIVCPIRPARPDFQSYRRGRNVMGDTPHILVVNQWSLNGGGDQEFIDSVSTMCGENDIPFHTMKKRRIFQHSIDNASTVFHELDSTYGVTEAKREIRELAQIIEANYPDGS